VGTTPESAFRGPLWSRMIKVRVLRWRSMITLNSSRSVSPDIRRVFVMLIGIYTDPSANHLQSSPYCHHPLGRVHPHALTYPARTHLSDTDGRTLKRLTKQQQIVSLFTFSMRKNEGSPSFSCKWEASVAILLDCSEWVLWSCVLCTGRNFPVRLLVNTIFSD